MINCYIKSLQIIILLTFLGVSHAEIYLTDEIVSSKKINKTVYELRWALTKSTWNTKHLFITVHQGITENASQSVFNLYSPTWIPPEPMKYKHILEIRTQAQGGSHFTEPSLVWAMDERDKRRQILIVTELVHGTAGIKEYSLFEIKPNTTTERLEFEPAIKVLQKHVKTEESICGSGGHNFSTYPFTFRYAINIKNERPCKALRGSFEGEYKLVGNKVLYSVATRTSSEFFNP